jgi:hypothetical protein
VETSEIEELKAIGWREIKDDILDEVYYIPPAESLEFVPHKDAPIFDNIEEGRATLTHLMENWKETLASPEGFDVIRQACLVSLWFFLKYVASYSGPYGDLTDHLHISMANFRQKQLHAGARGAVFVPRSMYKSTVMTHGAITWELLRDPELRVGIASGTTEKAEEFMHQVQTNFEANKLIRLLFPTHCPKIDEETGELRAKNWTKKKMVMPNRTKQYPEPSVKCLGAGAASAGNHFDLLAVDDIVSDTHLNAQHDASTEMMKISNWFNSNQDTLLIAPKYSRVFVAATRYAVDDPYDRIFIGCKNQVGYWDEVPYTLNPEGLWNVYYRMAIEENKCIFPEKIDKKFLARLKIDNPWSYFTQYLNNPFDAQSNEFNNYQIKECELDYTVGSGYTINYFSAGEHRRVNLADCEVNLGIDPNASDTKMSNRTSRCAIVVRARDCNNKRFYIDGFVDYPTPAKFYDQLFRLYGKYKDYVDSTNLEAQGGFKIIFMTMQEEQQKRQTYVNLRRISPLPQKDAKLRNFVQPLLDQGLVYAAHPIRQYIEEEVMTFPGGLKRDTLDAMEIADRFSIRPLTGSERAFEKTEEESYRSKVTNSSGY